MWKKFFARENNAQAAVGKQNNGDGALNVPRHVAVIMDGNGRWAKAKGLMRTAGHREGVGTLKKILRKAKNLGIEVLTVYAFSTENWKRPAAEVDFLMSLFAEYLQKEVCNMHEENVRIRFIGKTEDFSPALQKQIADAENLTCNNDGILFNVAANYGGRDEICRAARKIAVKVQSAELSIDDITEETFDGFLDTAAEPPVDLVIRTSGDMRLSNFLLWQAAYAEFYFTDTNWPDFTPEEFAAAIEDFSARDRRFGGI